MQSHTRLLSISQSLSLLFILLTLGFAAPEGRAQTAVSATTGGGNWSDPSIWNCTPALSPCVPNNTSSDVFNVENTGSLEVTQGVTVSGDLSNEGFLAVGYGYAGDLDVGGNLINGTSEHPGEVAVEGSLGGPASSSVTVGGTLQNNGLSSINLRGISASGGTGPGGGSAMAVEGAGLSLNASSISLSAGNDQLSDYDGCCEVDRGGSAELSFDGSLDSSGSITLQATSGLAEANPLHALPYVEAAPGGDAALNVAGSLTNSGSISLSGGSDSSFCVGSYCATGAGGEALVSVGGAVTTSGTVEIGSGAATLDAVGGYTQTGGTTDITGKLVSPKVDVEGGTVSGSGTIEGDVVNDAVVSPGDPATLTIGGNYIQDGDGTLIIDILGATDYSILDVTGTATLDGAIEFDFLDGYVPSGDTDFAFVEAAGGVSGFFTGLDLQGISCSDCAFHLTAAGTTADFTWDPALAAEPPSLLLLLLALLALGWALRHRSRAGGGPCDLPAAAHEKRTVGTLNR
ncbi:MAG: hypothetical protein ACRD2G_02315 [Terriglobia bacterium]